MILCLDFHTFTPLTFTRLQIPSSNFYYEFLRNDEHTRGARGLVGLAAAGARGSSQGVFLLYFPGLPGLPRIPSDFRKKRLERACLSFI